MPRIPRNYLKTQNFHVMVQGINKSYIFENSIDIKYYIKILHELAEKYSVKILAYCIMNNHAHILVTVKNTQQLSKYMHHINTKYGIYYNKKYNRVGYVFRDRYRSEGIFSNSHLNKCIQYIYNNPVKAGICKNPWDYPFSNYKFIDEESSEIYDFIDFEDKVEYEVALNKYLLQSKSTLQ